MVKALRLVYCTYSCHCIIKRLSNLSNKLKYKINEVGNVFLVVCVCVFYGHHLVFSWLYTIDIL